MRILFLGRTKSFLSHFYIQELSNIGDVVVLNTHPSEFMDSIPGQDVKIYNLYRDRKKFSNTFSNWIWFYPRVLLKSYKWHNFDKVTAEYLYDLIYKEKIDFVFGWWGADILYELNILVKLSSSVNIIWALIVFPSAQFGYARFMENILTTRIVNQMDGLVFGSELQKIYFLNKYKGSESKNSCVFTQTISNRAFATKKLEKLSAIDGKIHIVFLGRTDFSRDIRKIKDDIRFYLEELDRGNIVIHLSKTDSVIKNNNIRYFTPFENSKVLSGEFANFISQFDLCLVGYNYRDVKYTDRFDTGIPARMTSAISSGIPVIIPEGTMKASVEFISKHAIGFSYSNADDLISQVENPGFDKIKENAYVKSKNFTFEKEFEPVLSMIKDMKRNSKRNTGNNKI